jgi:hypothetical protein
LAHETSFSLVSPRLMTFYLDFRRSEPVVCNEPIEVVSYKIGVCRVSPKGKECRTEFERLSYNGKTSVVLCRPHTGRMHQIRVHLQYLGIFCRFPFPLTLFPHVGRSIASNSAVVSAEVNEKETRKAIIRRFLGN